MWVLVLYTVLVAGDPARVTIIDEYPTKLECYEELMRYQEELPMRNAVWMGLRCEYKNEKHT